jgi:hypothetical protein
MTIYVIERKIEKGWWPLAMFPVVDSSALGLTCETYSCIWTTEEKAKAVLKVIKTTYPNGKFRIKEYERKVK